MAKSDVRRYSVPKLINTASAKRATSSHKAANPATINSTLMLFSIAGSSDRVPRRACQTAGILDRELGPHSFRYSWTIHRDIGLIRLRYDNDSNY